MSEAKKASFTFKEFTVPNFSFKSSSKEELELDLLFEPSGEFNRESNIYSLNLNFRGLDAEDRSEVISVDSLALFKISGEIPEYFYMNSIAIIFPYVRAFISTMTLQSNTGIIVLETLNLTGLKEVLKENTKTI